MGCGGGGIITCGVISEQMTEKMRSRSAFWSRSLVGMSPSSSILRTCPMGRARPIPLELLCALPSFGILGMPPPPSGLPPPAPAPPPSPPIAPSPIFGTPPGAADAGRAGAADAGRAGLGFSPPPPPPPRPPSPSLGMPMPMAGRAVCGTGAGASPVSIGSPPGGGGAPPPPRLSLTIPGGGGGAPVGCCCAAGGAAGAGATAAGAGGVSTGAKRARWSSGNCACCTAPAEMLGSMHASSDEHSIGWPSAWPHSSASRWFSSRASGSFGGR